MEAKNLNTEQIVALVIFLKSLLKKGERGAVFCPFCGNTTVIARTEVTGRFRCQCKTDNCFSCIE